MTMIATGPASIFPRLEPLLTLPSQHETGYPGLYRLGEELWMSYYSSESGKCAVYNARIEIAAPTR